MIGIGDTHTFYPPQYPRRRITTNHDITSGIIGTLYSGKVGSHTCGLTSTTGVSICFFYRKLSGRDSGHFIGSFTVSTGFYNYFIELHGSFFHFQIKDYLFSGIHYYVID